MADIKIKHKRVSCRVNNGNNTQVDEVKWVNEFIKFYNNPLTSEKAKEILRKEIQNN